MSSAIAAISSASRQAVANSARSPRSLGCRWRRRRAGRSRRADRCPARPARRPKARFVLFEVCDRGRASEHAVAVGRCLRYLLDDIPVLDDLAILEAEEVHKRSPRVFWIAGFEIDIRMGCDEIALRDDPLDV